MTFHIVNLKGSHALWDIPFGQRVVAEYNKSWQPVGMYALKLRRMTGNIVKSGNFVKLRDNWREVPLRTKEDVWDALMV
jgi:hypothetical protein